MGIDLYGFVEGFDEAKGVWENISPLTDLSQMEYDGYGYPKEAGYLFGKPLPEMLDVVRDKKLHQLLQDTSGEKIKGLSTLNVKEDTEKATKLSKDIHKLMLMSFTTMKLKNILKNEKRNIGS